MSIAKPQTASLIDILNQGFAVINRRLWVIAIPVVLNLYYWYGAQVSLQPFIQNMVGLLQRLARSADSTGTLAFYEGWRTIGDYDLAQRFDALELVPRLTIYGITRAQDGMPLVEQGLPPLEQARVVFSINNGSLAALLFLLTNIILIPIGAVFLTMVANTVRYQRLRPFAWLRQWARVALAIVGYGAILLAATVVVCVPLVFVGALLFAAAPALGLLVVLMLTVALFWVDIYLGFAPEAIAVADLDPIQAFRASFSLVRRNFWATLGLLAISLIISIGLGVVWATLVDNAFGRIIAVLGSAYVGSGLVAARMVFYRERVKTRVQVTGYRGQGTGDRQ